MTATPTGLSSRSTERASERCSRAARTSMTLSVGSRSKVRWKTPSSIRWLTT